MMEGFMPILEIVSVNAFTKFCYKIFRIGTVCTFLSIAVEMV